MSLVFSNRRPVGRGIGVCVLALSALLVSCSSDGVLDVRPPADVGSHTASIPQNEVRALEPEPGPVQAEVEPLRPQMAQAFPAPENPARIASDAEPDQSFMEPEVSTDDEAPMSIPDDSGESLAEEMETTGQPTVMAAYPRPIEPRLSEPPVLERIEPQRPRASPMSRSDIACRQQLQKLKVKFVELKPIHDSSSCQIAHPVKVMAIGSVEMKPAATLNCEMAATFAAWTRNELVPSARWKYFSGVKTIHQGSAYSCRKIARSRTMSSHSQGNALDVMALTLNNGKKIDIKKQGLFAFRARGLLNNVRADGCQYFSTVLGPGYNYDHRNHFHFDLMKRRNGKVACH